jgi:hypothetical protein
MMRKEAMPLPTWPSLLFACRSLIVISFFAIDPLYAVARVFCCASWSMLSTAPSLHNRVYPQIVTMVKNYVVFFTHKSYQKVIDTSALSSYYRGSS